VYLGWRHLPGPGGLLQFAGVLTCGCCLTVFMKDAVFLQLSRMRLYPGRFLYRLCCIRTFSWNVSPHSSKEERGAKCDWQSLLLLILTSFGNLEYIYALFLGMQACSPERQRQQCGRMPVEEVEKKRLLLRVVYSFPPQNRWWLKCSRSFGCRFFAELWFRVQ